MKSNNKTNKTSKEGALKTTNAPKEITSMETVEIKTSQLISAFCILRRLIETIEDSRLRESQYYFHFSFQDTNLIIGTPTCNGATLSITIPFQSGPALQEPVHILVRKPVCFMIYSLQRKCESVSFRFDNEDDVLTIGYQTGLFRMKCQTLSLDDINNRRRLIGEIQMAKIEPKLLVDGIKYTGDLCASHRTHCGKITEYLHIDIHNGYAEFAGTNGKGLVRYRKAINESSNLLCNIHAKYSDVLQKLMSYGLESISTDGATVTLSSDRYQFSCPASPLRYPEYSNFIPTTEDTIATTTISRFALTHSAALVNSCEADNTIINIEVTRDAVSLKGCNTRNTSKTSETLNHIFTSGIYTACIDGASLSRVLKTLACENVTVSYTGEGKPLIISSNEEKGLIFLLFPFAHQNNAE